MPLPYKLGVVGAEAGERAEHFMKMISHPGDVVLKQLGWIVGE